MSSAEFEPAAVDYHVHITRGESWNESGENPISLNEWIRLVERDAELQLAHPQSREDEINEVPPTEQNGLACWTGWSRHADGNAVWFAYHDGRITVANPDNEVLRRMAWIARNLEAQVQGDCGEVYDLFGEPITIPDDDYKPGVFDFFRRFKGFCYLLIPLA